MRIRKHASRIAFTDNTAAAAAATTTTTASIPTTSTSCERVSNLETHVCVLNRSPWDVITFSPQLSDFYFPHQYQVVVRENEEEEDDDDESGVTGNTIDEELANAFESIASEVEEEEEESTDDDDEETEDDEKRFSLLVDVDEEEKKKNQKLGFVCCNKTDGKGWKCQREAKNGHSLCDHHLAQLRSYHYTTTIAKASKVVKPVGSINATGRGRGQRRNKSRVSSGNKPAAADFYYYSGFGPLWGKKRRGGNGNGNNDNQVMMMKRKQEKEVEAQGEIQIQNQSQTPLSYVDYDDDDVDNDDDDDDDNDGKKRTRKPIKARSLKSLL